MSRPNARRPIGRLAAITGLLALVVLLVAASGSAAPASTDPGSRGAGKPGGLVLYSWLASLGFTTSRVTGTFDPAGADVLIISEPTVGFSDHEVTTVEEFLRQGGEVIIAVDDAGARTVGLLLDRLLGTSHPADSHGAGIAHAVQPLDSGGTARSLPMDGGPAFGVAPGVVPLFTMGGAGVVVGAEGRGGEGGLFVIGSSLPLSNDGLRRNDSAAMVLAIVERARGESIAFDEYHHGEIGQPGASDIFGGPVGVALLLFGVVVIGYLAITGRRMGRSIPAGDPARVPSAGEYVNAMAALIERSQHRGGVADRYANELKQRIGTVAGADPRLTDGEFVAALAGYPAEQVGVVATALARAHDFAVSSPSEETLLQLARHIDALERVWAGRPSPDR